MPVRDTGPRYEQGYQQDLVGATVRVRDDGPSAYGFVDDETTEKVKIRWAHQGGSTWVHKRDIVVLS